MLYTCAGALSTTKACLKLFENHPVIRCEKDSACFQDALLSLMEVYAKKMLSAASNVAGSEGAVEAKRCL